MYERILIATDGSPAATRALEDAIALTDQFGSSLVVLSVAQNPMAHTVDPEVPSQAYHRIEKALEEAAQGVVDDAVALARSHGIEVRGVTHRAQRAQAGILKVAAEEDADLIVVGTHGRSGVKRFLLGSVAEGVVRSSPIPVLTVRYADEGG